MTKEEQIIKLQDDVKYCQKLRQKLILEEGLPLDNPAVQQLEERRWKLLLQLYILREKNIRRRNRILRDLGINLN